MPRRPHQSNHNANRKHGATLTIAIVGADTVNLSVNGTGNLVVTDTTASVADSTTGSLFGGGSGTTVTESNTLATDDFTAINVTGNSAVGLNLSFIGGTFSDASGPAVTANTNLPTVNFTTAASTFGGSLTVQTTTPITQLVAINVTGASSFSAGANAITLTQNNSLTGAITLSNSGANNVQLTNATATSLAASTVGQNLTVSSTGAITETGVLTVPGTLTTNSATGTNLGTSTNAVAGFSASNSGIGAVSLLDSTATLTISGINDTTAGGPVTVNNTSGAISLTGTIRAGTNTVNLTANGAITQTPLAARSPPAR